MPSVYDLKPRFQAILRPVCGRLVRLGITANAVTVFAACLSIAAGASIAIWSEHPQVLLMLPSVLLVRMALNAIDGMIAREFNMKSDLGAVLNELGDIISDAALYLPLAYVAGFEAWAIVVVVVLAGVTETAGVLMAQLGASRRYDGPMGKSDRALVFGILGLLIALGTPVGVWLDGVLLCVMALLALTVLRRVIAGLAELRTSPGETV